MPLRTLSLKPLTDVSEIWNEAEKRLKTDHSNFSLAYAGSHYLPTSGSFPNPTQLFEIRWQGRGGTPDKEMEILVETNAVSLRKSFPCSWKLWKVAKTVGLKITEDIYFVSDDFKGGRSLAGITLEDLYQVEPFWLKIYEEQPTQSASGDCLGQTTPPHSPTCSLMKNSSTDGEVSSSVAQVIEEIQSASEDVSLPSGKASNHDSPSRSLPGVSFSEVESSTSINPVIEEIQSASEDVSWPSGKASNHDSLSRSLLGVSFSEVESSTFVSPVIEEIQSAPEEASLPSGKASNFDSPSCSLSEVLSSEVESPTFANQEFPSSSF
jgi:hypothetical protein